LSGLGHGLSNYTGWNECDWFVRQIAAPAPAEIAAFLGCLFFLVAGWNQLERFLDRRSRRPGPPPDPAPAPSEVADLQRPPGQN
jgi:hypothetical protein